VCEGNRRNAAALSLRTSSSAKQNFVLFGYVLRTSRLSALHIPDKGQDRVEQSITELNG